MDRCRLKNTIILILLLINVFLLGSMAYRSTAARSAHNQAVEQLVELFAADGLELDPGAIPVETPPPGCVLARDTALERSAAVYLLGGGLVHSERGGVYSYSGSKGAALFRENGDFEAAGTLASSEGEEFCERFFRDFHYAELTTQLDGDGSETAAGSTETDLLSAQAALIAFQSMRRETGAVASSVAEMHLCYELQSSTAAPMSLVPAWCIVTDTVNYYVNCASGAVSQY